MKPRSTLNHLVTQCHKGGIKIKSSANEYKENPFAEVKPLQGPKQQIPVTHTQSSFEKINLNIDEYSREELFHLFGIQGGVALTEEVMKNCKKIVLKTHPDKSKLHEDYFLFFSKAYKKLLSIYEFQNKTKPTTQQQQRPNQYAENPYDEEHIKMLDTLFQTKKELKKTENFNQWFNEQFETQKIEEPTDAGYGDWLQSEEGITYMPNISMSQMNAEIAKKKREVQSLVTYKGVTDVYSPACGGTALLVKGDNFSSDTLFSSDGVGYSDLRQAYMETVVPVTDEDYHNMQKFNTVGEYKKHRDQVDVAPLSKEEAMRQLFQESQQKEEESAALAYYYAQQSEKVAKNKEQFWSNLKQLTW
jgi:hypothetical protein